VRAWISNRRVRLGQRKERAHTRRESAAPVGEDLRETALYGGLTFKIEF